MNPVKSILAKVARISWLKMERCSSQISIMRLWTMITRRLLFGPRKRRLMWLFFTTRRSLVAGKKARASSTWPLENTKARWHTQTQIWCWDVITSRERCRRRACRWARGSFDNVLKRGRPSSRLQIWKCSRCTTSTRFWDRSQRRRLRGAASQACKPISKWAISRATTTRDALR